MQINQIFSSLQIRDKRTSFNVYLLMLLYISNLINHELAKPDLILSMHDKLWGKNESLEGKPNYDILLLIKRTSDFTRSVSMSS